MQKEKRRMADRDWIKSLAVAMTALAAALLIVGWGRGAQLAEARARINAAAQKAFYETCEMTESMSVNLRKLMVAGESGQVQQLLGEVSRLSCAVRDSLSALPAEPERMSAVLADISALSDQTQAMLAALTRSGSLTPEQLSTLRSALADCTLLSGQLALPP